jgi:ferric-dicitrate binding protein FerR (iron transport regulator)
MADEQAAESTNADGRENRDDDARGERGDKVGEEAPEDNKRKSGMDPRKRRRFIAIAAIVVILVAVGAVLWWLQARNY